MSLRASGRGGGLNYGGLLPIYDFVDLDFTAQVKRIKDTMYVVFNRAREKFVVKDVDAHSTHYIVMIVQEPNGSFRPFDERTLETLRKVVQRGPDVKKIEEELTFIEVERMLKLERVDDELQYAFESDFKWAGKDVTPSTIWRDRTWHR